MISEYRKPYGWETCNIKQTQYQAFAIQVYNLNGVLEGLKILLPVSAQPWLDRSNKNMRTGVRRMGSLSNINLLR